MWGADLTDVDGFAFVDSAITDCTIRLGYIRRSKDVSFISSVFSDTSYNRLFEVSGSQDVAFDGVTFTRNRANTRDVPEKDLFHFGRSTSAVELRNSKLVGNDVLIFSDKPSTVAKPANAAAVRTGLDRLTAVWPIGQHTRLAAVRAIP